MDVDTIAAIVTGAGDAGVAIVRISGPRAVAVAAGAFRRRRGGSLSDVRSHRLTLGEVVMPGTGRVVDQAMAAVMRAPRTYTGEDVVELNCHGGTVAPRLVLEAVLAAGARLAEPGEFTKRAFLNGRMDLTQAESVMDIIRSRTDRALAAAVGVLQGRLSSPVRTLRIRILDLITDLEADIDFPELELTSKTNDAVEAGIGVALGEIGNLLASARTGQVLRDGVRVVIAGRPNVGKSSLLNRLLRENRAIVSDVPGTTRDVVQEWFSLRGLPVVLADTAGIRASDDPLEQMGVQRSVAAVASAELVLAVADGGAGVTESDLVVAQACRGRQILGVMNKADLAADGRGAAAQWGEALGGAPVVLVSAHTGAGMTELENTLAELAGDTGGREVLVANLRQEDALRSAARHLHAATASLADNMGSDMVAIDLRSAWEALGEVVGENAGETLLDSIFSRFCIGK